MLKGSIGRKDNVKSYIDTTGHRMRLKLLESSVMHIEEDTVVFDKDHLFRSPSMAAQSLLGRTANGWVEWKDAHGKTLDWLKRQTPSPE